MIRDSLKSGEFENTSENSVDRNEATKIMANERNLNTDSAAAAGPQMTSPKRKDANMFNTQISGLEDVQLDEILECGDDLMEIEQTAFMGSSKIMLQMIDNMLKSIDSRIDSIGGLPGDYGYNPDSLVPPLGAHQ